MVALPVSAITGLLACGLFGGFMIRPKCDVICDYYERENIE